jgi:hypothetical protein
MMGKMYSNEKSVVCNMDGDFKTLQICTPGNSE